MRFNGVIAICQSKAEDARRVLERSQQFRRRKLNTTRLALQEGP